MKRNNFKKILSVAAVLAVSATAAISVVPLAACSENNDASSVEHDKLISADENHSVNTISTAKGTVRTESSGTVYYVAPDGSIANDGKSWDSPYPMFEMLKGEYLQLKPGDTVYVKPGVYESNSMVTVPNSVSGAYNKYIRIVNAALEKEESGYQGSETLVTLDFSAQIFASDQRGVQIYGNYIYWYGIDVCGAGDNGIYIGGSYNTVEFCEFYNNRDTGLQLGRADGSLTTIDQWPSYNLIKNCTSHNNYDNETYGENADGFAAKLTVGYGNVFDGCIAYRNSDDGWDLYAKTDSGNIGCVIIYNCVAFENGYLEYTQKENNDRFPEFDQGYTEVFGPEDDARYFRTRDGDGNGFKLGGSVMEGDVEMYNCLSFNNRMHGVTDNSNPGFLKVEGVTSYDNSAAVDDDPNSPTFGQIIAFVQKSDEEKVEHHANIDVSRQIYSYNSVIDTLSVNSSIAVKATADAYRGSVTDSVLSLGYAAIKTNYIEGSIDADTKNEGGVTYTRQGAALSADAVFSTLPIEMQIGENDERTYTFNLSGLHDLYVYDSQNGTYNTDGELNAGRVHVTYRNPDNSINMKQILAKKEGVDDTLLINGKNIGSELNKSSWEDYKHFFKQDFVDGSAENEDTAKVLRAKEVLTINTNADAVYQDFEVPVKLNGCKISWSTSDSSIVEVGTEVEESLSTSKYISMLVYRPLDEPVKATITATIVCGSATETKDFELTVMPGQPSIGEISVRTQKGEVIADGGSYVVDMFDVFKEPEILVENGLDYHGKLLSKDQYTYETTYLYSYDKNSAKIEIKGFTPSNAGVYTVTQTVTLKSDTSQVKSMTYTMYVSSATSDVDFINSSVTVNRDGYMITGELSNATGMIYAVSSSTEINVTKENIKTLQGVKSYSFRGDLIKYQFENPNKEAYNIYFALSNMNGEITSQIYKAQIGVVPVSTNDEFMQVAGGAKLGEEDATRTIYRLTSDLDFTGVKWSSGTNPFTGYLNGAGHTVQNVTISQAVDKTGMFSKVAGGTIANIKFENISISNSDKKQTGIVAVTEGGYFHNISIKNIKVQGGERTGGLIGQAFEGNVNTEISQVSIVNDNDTDYYILAGTQVSKAKRAGGLIGLIQTTSAPVNGSYVYISDCYVVASISGLEQVGGMVGGFDNAKAGLEYYLEITRCYFGGTVASTHTTPRIGGMIGYQSGNAGFFNVTSCISLGKLVSQGYEVEYSLKSASPIIGGFSSTAANRVSRCIAKQEEYNSDFMVEIYLDRNLQRNKNGIIESIFNKKYENYEKIWSFVSAEDPEHPNWLKAPYLVLNFVEN